jgi:hypothetical protein
MPEIIYKDYKNEIMLFETHRYLFEIHLENFGNSMNKSSLIENLVYQNKSFDEYIEFRKNEFIGDARKEYYPPMIDDDGKEYFYHSELIESYNIEYYNDLFVIIKYQNGFYNSGAAHGNYGTRYHIIDLTERRSLNINDLVFQIPDDLLKEFIEEKYEVNYYLDEKIWPPDTINFQNDSISLIWNTYSITPYSMGTIEIIIQDMTVESYFKEKGKNLKESMKKK